MFVWLLMVALRFGIAPCLKLLFLSVKASMQTIIYNMYLVLLINQNNA